MTSTGLPTTTRAKSCQAPNCPATTYGVVRLEVIGAHHEEGCGGAGKQALSSKFGVELPSRLVVAAAPEYWCCHLPIDRVEVPTIMRGLRPGNQGHHLAGDRVARARARRLSPLGRHVDVNIRQGIASR